MLGCLNVGNNSFLKFIYLSLKLVETLIEASPNVYSCSFSSHLIPFIIYRRDNMKVNGCLEKQGSIRMPFLALESG